MDPSKEPQGTARKEIICPACSTHFIVLRPDGSLAPQYCPYCKAVLTSQTSEESIPPTSVTLLHEQVPAKDKILFTVGPYQVLEEIGKGGMGEVFLAYDTICGRRIALKRIRPDLMTLSHLHGRFLKEARITSQLTHPAIIPIYTIQSAEVPAYYTMPFVEGQTLKQILSIAHQQEIQGAKQDHLSTIPSLTRIFLSVCQGVAYAHSKGVIHRDLKPNNIIVGPYGEVLILDWGLAKLSSQLPTEAEAALAEPDGDLETHELTFIGKVVGTLSYMAPERIFGHPATYQTDIYSLGVILYLILTLHHPFHRRNIKEFRRNVRKEHLLDPAEVAPYREVPPILSRIAARCLEFNPEERYRTVDELIHDLESYIEGRSEWLELAELNIHKKSDWEFQENVLIAEHMAITRGTEVSDWVILMISKASFAGNTKLEARVRIGEKGQGIGFLLSVPEAPQRTHLNSGYCLWLASDLNKATKLLRSTVEVIYTSDVFLPRGSWQQVRIEKIENNIHFYLNDVLQFSYISHLPLSGTHIGLLSRDADFSIENLRVSVGSQNIKVNCLAVPDAFLAHKDYATALSEYRRIAYAFPGTAEGRDAKFRAGITLLEEARNCSDKEKSRQKSEESLEEFGKLHNTPGGPLEYLGKALVYQSLGEYEEEIKCFELAFRRYPRHPMMTILYEQLIFRMYDSSRYHRIATFHFALLAIRHLPESAISSDARRLFNSIAKNWEPLYFMEESIPAIESLQMLQLAIPLAFWLALPHTLIEIIDDVGQLKPPPLPALNNAFFALFELGLWETASHKLETIYHNMAEYQGPLQKDEKKALDCMRIVLLCHQESPQSAVKALFTLLSPIPDQQELRVVHYLMQEAIGNKDTALVHEIAAKMTVCDLSTLDRLNVDCFQIWAYLLDKEWKLSEELLHHYSLEQLTQESSLLHFLYGCWLYVRESKEIASIHFASVLEVAYPRSWTLFSHFFHKPPVEMQQWLQKAFLWEKRQLYRQLTLFYHCAGDAQQSLQYQKLEKETYVRS